jgi:RHS repeat-associated protein
MDDPAPSASQGFGLMFYVSRWYDPALGRFVQADTLVPDPGDPGDFDRYAYGLNNPLKYIDPSGHWPAWLDFILGAGYQFINDMSWGVPNAVFGTDWQEDQSVAFQQGQQLGHGVSTVVAITLTVDGTFKVGAGMAGLAAGTTCTVVTAGGCSIIAVPATAIERGLIMEGAAEAAYGGSILAYASSNPTEAPRYTARNFRRNLENRTPIPQGMRNPQAHHMLPEALEKEFSRLGVNVHDPRWGAWVEGTPPGTHQNWSYAFNQAWKEWLNKNRGATLEQIIAQTQKMATEYGINWSWQP